MSVFVLEGQHGPFLTVVGHWGCGEGVSSACRSLLSLWTDGIQGSRVSSSSYSFLKTRRPIVKVSGYLRTQCAHGLETAYCYDQNIKDPQKAYMLTGSQGIATGTCEKSLGHWGCVFLLFFLLSQHLCFTTHSCHNRLPGSHSWIQTSKTVSQNQIFLYK